jgi:hypothetical protein
MTLKSRQLNLSLKLNINKLRVYHLSPATEKLHQLNFSDGCINTHNKLHVKIGEATKKVPHKLCKNKRFKKKYLYFLLEAYLSQNNNI